MSTEDRIIVRGGKRLEGNVVVGGSKNAAVAIICASAMIKGKVTLENIPKITDIQVLLDTLSQIGATVNWTAEKTVQIDTTDIKSYVCDNIDLSTLRGSYYFVGSLLGRFRQAKVVFPGGCNFAPRPIDQHIYAFETLGCTVETTGGYITAKARKLVGNNIYFDNYSVGATINSILAATLAEGTTTIENANREPHVVDVANFLNIMGADIKGAGTNTIRIKGVKELLGGKSYSVCPDMIEAGTLMIAAAATRGTITLHNVTPEHMDSLSTKLTEMGVIIETMDDSITVKANIKRVKSTNIKTMPYPGFPTDLHPQFATLLSIADGESRITEGVFPTRFQYVEQLHKLGANIQLSGESAIIKGVPKLIGAPVSPTDLRAAAAMVIAGLMAEGQTTIHNLEYLDRGYEDFIEKLKSLKAVIERGK
ncbi:MAG TPA: UDP-N-acetylglucosamine 1-carboxyvinyltransferase [Clostridia bacterium]|nr:MAG: UDP-N-acetylglucosamine 1-carboxyvinyltransferase 2 [Firmicutes bacterium ADurb.Bin146]HOD93444.1 UDP-N-acetylglucosamine 1-carboxyvinyltransferase [Clostridia bacterium]HQM40125.1 UDP-N-acetylglucosamine 1-carboxyvinyltransferase [Clostridia bacterium]